MVLSKILGSLIFLDWKTQGAKTITDDWSVFKDDNLQALVVLQQWKIMRRVTSRNVQADRANFSQCLRRIKTVYLAQSNCNHDYNGNRNYKNLIMLIKRFEVHELIRFMLLISL